MAVAFLWIRRWRGLRRDFFGEHGFFLDWIFGVEVEPSIVVIEIFCEGATICVDNALDDACDATGDFAVLAKNGVEKIRYIHNTAVSVGGSSESVASMKT